MRDRAGALHCSLHARASHCLARLRPLPDLATIRRGSLHKNCPAGAFMMVVRRHVRSIFALFAALFLVIGCSQPLWAQTPPRTAFGSLFNPAHMPDGVTT